MELQLNVCDYFEQLRTVADSANEEPKNEAHVSVPSPENFSPVVQLIQNPLVFLDYMSRFVI